MAHVIPFPKKSAPKARKYATKGKKVDDFNALGHLVIGSLIGLFIAHTSLGFALVLFGSLLIDADHSKSTLGKWNPLTKRWVPRPLRWTHRGHCHSIIGAILLSAPFCLISMTAFLLVFAGCIGHLLADKFLSLFPKHKHFKLKVW